jgi:hypothetical protein
MIKTPKRSILSTTLKSAMKKDGGAKGDRTPDLNAASVALSQLSSGPRKLAF